MGLKPVKESKTVWENLTIYNTTHRIRQREIPIDVTIFHSQSHACFFICPCLLH